LSALAGKKFRRVFVAGMGGSSLPVDLINDYLNGDPYLHPLRDYALPAHLNSDDLLVVSSFSGNTEETLAALEAGLGKGLSIVILSNGGKLREIAERRSLPFIPIPDCIQPRCATGYFFASLLGILEKTGLTGMHEAELAALAQFLESRRAIHEALGQEIAAQLKDKLPIVYGTPGFEGVVRVWKIKINENAKVQAFGNVFPELNHNEMVGWTRLVTNPAIIYLKSSRIDPRNAKRMSVMESLLSGKMPFIGVELRGSSHLEEMFDALAVADYATFYLAKAYGIDPAPVAMVEDFKKRL